MKTAHPITTAAARAALPFLTLVLLPFHGAFAAESAAAGESAPRVDVFVSPDGNDGWSGRLSSPNKDHSDGPLATPLRARDTVREIRRQPPEKPVRIQVRGGKYYLPTTLELGPDDSGTEEAPVTWAAYAGEHPVFSGGAKVDRWAPYEGDILVADLSQIGENVHARDFYFNGKRQVRARTPNRDERNPLHGGWAFMEGPAGPDGFLFPPGLLTNLSSPGEAEVRFFVGPNGGWGSDLVAVTGIDYGQRQIRTNYAYGGHALLGFNSNTRFVVENALELLDQPGEWCARAGKLYFWPPEPFSEDFCAVVPALSTLVRFSNARWITFAGFTLAETPPRGNDALRCEDSHDIRITGNRIQETGSRGIGVVGEKSPCTGVQVSGNEIAGTGGSALYVGGDVRKSLIAENEIHHCGFHDKYSAGIEFPFYGGSASEVGPDRFTDDIRIAGNYLHDLPRDGIQLGANPFGRNAVRHNRIERVGLETLDAGGIRCHRTISHLWGVAQLPEMKGHIIEHNVVTDTVGCGVTDGRIVTPYPWPTFGIYLDEGSSNCTVRENVVARSGVGLIMNPGANNTIENNIFTENSVGLYFQAPAPLDALAPPPGGNRFVRNIVYVNATGALAMRLHSFKSGTLSESNANLFWNAAGPVNIETQDGGAPSLLSFEAWQAAGHDLDSRVADPGLRGDSRGGYTFPVDSPASQLGIQPVGMPYPGTPPGPTW